MDEKPIELLPCECGAKPNLTYYVGGVYSAMPFYRVKCPACNSGVEVHMTNTTLRNQKETKERAIALWNRR